MNKEKIDLLLKILEDLSFSQWEIIKREIDSIYGREQEKNVPNSQLGTLEENLKHWCENLRKYKI